MAQLKSTPARNLPMIPKHNAQFAFVLNWHKILISKQKFNEFARKYQSFVGRCCFAGCQAHWQVPGICYEMKTFINYKFVAPARASFFDGNQNQFQFIFRFQDKNIHWIFKFIKSVEFSNFNHFRYKFSIDSTGEYRRSNRAGSRKSLKM